MVVVVLVFAVFVLCVFLATVNCGRLRNTVPLERPILDLATRSPVGRLREAAVLVPGMLHAVTHAPGKQLRLAARAYGWLPILDLVTHTRTHAHAHSHAAAEHNRQHANSTDARVCCLARICIHMTFLIATQSPLSRHTVATTVATVKHSSRH